MVIQSPLPDDVFLTWLNKADDKKVKKKFGISKSAPIQVSENIKNVTKSVAFFFRTEILPISSKSSIKPEILPVGKLRSQKFYTFQNRIVADDWSNKDLEVLLFDQIKQDSCKKCSGKGVSSCDKCKGKGVFTCEKCKGEGKGKCSYCNGSGKQVIEVEVLVDLEKRKKQVETQCPECFGEGSLPCKKCGGLGRIGCDKCKGSAVKACSECDGYGVFFIVPYGPVPITKDTGYRIFVEKMFDRIQKDPEEFNRLLHIKKVDSIQIKSLNDLDENYMAKILMVPKLDGAVKKSMDQARKEFENMEKSFEKKKDIEKPISPIEIFPLLRLDVKTVKGATFEIYAVGSDQGYIILDRGFK